MSASSRTSSAPRLSHKPTHLEGVVIRSTGSWYDVQTSEGVIAAKMRGKFRLNDRRATNPVVVGDRVTLRLNADETGLITAIHERRNKLTRRAAGRKVGMEHVLVTNIDAAWVVQSIRTPKLNPGFIDRFLVMAASHNIPAGIVFNKVDLMQPKDEEEIAFWQDLYASLGYPVMVMSATEGEGVETFREALYNRTSVVAGPSGAGKSTLLNAISPDLNLRVGAVSEKTRKGRHTTTNAALFPIGNEGYVVDTPGVREFGVIDLAPSELGYYFVEFRDFLVECHFPDCTHDHEPNCAVKFAFNEDLIAAERYLSYLNILDSLRQGQADVGR